MDNEQNEPLVNLDNNTPPAPPSPLVEPKVYTMPSISAPTPTSPPVSPASMAVNTSETLSDHLKKISDLFKNSIKTIWSKKWRFLHLTITPKILVALPMILVLVLYLISSLLIKDSILKNIINIILGILFFISIIYFILYALWSQAATVYYLRTVEVSKKIILKQSKKQAKGLLWTTIVSGFMAFGWLILFLIVAALWSIFVDNSSLSLIVLGILSLVITIFSIIRSIRFSLAGIIKLVEGLPAVASVKRSKALIINYSWPVFKRQIMLSYLQFIIQISFSVIMILVFGLGSINKVFLILAIILGLAIFLFMTLISFLLEPFNYAYYYDVYQNLSAIKSKDINAQEKHGFGYYLGIFGLLILLPLLWVGMFFLNLIFNSSSADLSALSKLAPFLSNTGLNLNSNTNLNLENLDTNNQLEVVDKNTAFDFLKELSDDDIKEKNNYLTFFFKSLPGNPNKEDLPVFNAEELRQILNSAGYNADKTMSEFSLEKQKFIWNSFYIGMASSAESLENNNISSYEQINLNDFSFPEVSLKNLQNYSLEQFNAEALNMYHAIPGKENAQIPPLNKEILDASFVKAGKNPIDFYSKYTPAEQETYWKLYFVNSELSSYNQALKSDSDSDGLVDFKETEIYHTDPNNPDSDGDSYQDGDEVLNGYDPMGPGKLTF